MTNPARIVPDNFSAAEFRVNQSSPCPVCGKPDWCLSDGQTWALCQRTDNGQRWNYMKYRGRLGKSKSTLEKDMSFITRLVKSNEEPLVRSVRIPEEVIPIVEAQLQTTQVYCQPVAPVVPISMLNLMPKTPAKVQDSGQMGVTAGCQSRKNARKRVV